MQVLTPSLDFAAFLERVARAPARLLMLDYDGTLAPFHVQPECAVPYDGVEDVLGRIVASGTRVILVSGRPAQQIPPLLKLSPPPEIWGSHGWERLLPDGSRVTERPAADAQRVLHSAAAQIEAVLPDASRLERKPASIAVHWRGLADDVAERLQRVTQEIWEPVSRQGAVEILPFGGGLELRAVGCNKQYAVKAVLSETAEDTPIAYLGDDITDEDAFRAVRTRGIGVLVRPESRETSADVWLRPPEELIEFMSRWAVQAH